MWPLLASQSKRQPWFSIIARLSHKEALSILAKERKSSPPEMLFHYWKNSLYELEDSFMGQRNRN